MYKPKNWKNFLNKALEKDPDVDGYYSNEYLMEAGADAMLCALKDEAEYLHNNGLAPYGYVLGKSLKLGEKGWLVFIPDN